MAHRPGRRFPHDDAESRKWQNPDAILSEIGLGPPLEIRFDTDKAVNLIESAGFEVESITEHGPYHYLRTASPA